MGGLILVAVAMFLRRVLHMGPKTKARVSGWRPLRADLQAIYQPLEQEIEAHTTIIGITLNDAFGRRRANQHEMAWNTVRLVRGEWQRLAELVVGLLSILGKFLPSTYGIVAVRRLAVGHFKSRVVMDNVGLYEFLDQILFNSKHRYALKLRFLFRASAVLSKEFHRACREGALSQDSSDELWTRLDYYFHDFDLIAKETLLAFRTLLVCQSPEGARELALDLQMLLERGMRVSVSRLPQ